MTEQIENRPAVTSPSSFPANRYILIAVLALVAVVTIVLLKSNMERPKSAEDRISGTGESADMGGPMDSGSASIMADVARQVGHIKDILAKDSTNVDAWVALGNLYFDARMPEDAVKYYEGALRFKPGDVNIMTDLATMKRELKQPGDAIELLKKVVATDSTMAQAWFNMGVIYSFDLGLQKEAIGAWKHFLALNPASEHSEAVQHVIDSLERILPK